MSDSEPRISEPPASAGTRSLIGSTILVADDERLTREHLASLLRAAGGVPAYGNQRAHWDAGSRFGFANPEYR